MPTVGVLALQGDFREHLKVLERLGCETRPVRTRDDLEQVEAIIIPGGESTTIGKLSVRFGIFEPLRNRIEAGLPTFGTCAGMIFLAANVTEGHQPLLGSLDVVVERNAFGRQNDSFEADLDINGFDRPFPAVFIRAPWVAKMGNGVEVLATIDGHPVMVRQGRVLASSFHPELTGDDRIHSMFIGSI
ncbi:MAG TPA: pyridoxal 5'-phosphate synthase glutaminase subunit PdxT [Acidimicrobiia bacterium]|jgi:5'-phosphate synthase pdxT subunit|nr:pyridoxal 5'-phosphate synthase glutaminase subunit PdxT [Acidimicrobiia bacterium]